MDDKLGQIPGCVNHIGLIMHSNTHAMSLIREYFLFHNYSRVNYKIYCRSSVSRLLVLICQQGNSVYPKAFKQNISLFNFFKLNVGLLLNGEVDSHYCKINICEVYFLSIQFGHFKDLSAMVSTVFVTRLHILKNSTKIYIYNGTIHITFLKRVIRHYNTDDQLLYEDFLLRMEPYIAYLLLWSNDND